MKDGAQKEIKRMSVLAIWLDDQFSPWLFKKVHCLFYRPSFWRFVLPSNERLGEVTKIAQEHHISIRRANQLIMEELEDIVDQAGKDYRQRYRLLSGDEKKA